ncbi:uncharacterized protein DNG_03217 [Cephalotrichum gorgonifer]|uniref:AB hydrolase-1 domain-containing protein n=1 Tax=Cephalotrichum gorgonifer TaxID=2041049 RepID=A0AAE8MUG3_9PEZI|nr:uncharacterized protein DNG_03217 [Cephalotrichum gorgonifer]
MSEPTSQHHRADGLTQHYKIDNFTFKDGTGPTSIQLAYLDINPISEKVALVLTCFRGRLPSTTTFRDGALKGHRVIVVALFGNGESSSPSNMAEFPPSLNYEDCVHAQHQLISSHLEIQSIDVVVGFSMGGQCSYYWTLMYPKIVRNAVVICSSARTSRHNYQFLEGPKAALENSSDYRKGERNGTSTKPFSGLRAFGNN